MAIILDNFTFMNKNMKSFDCITVDFDSGSDIPLALSRSINKGETNTYRKVANHFGTTYDSPLEFEMHLCKNPATNQTQTEMIFSNDDIRLITRWLTSSSIPQWLKTETKDKTKRYKGIFTNIETFCVGGEVMGLKLTFTADSPYSYTDDIINSKNVTGYVSININNQSDELDDYVYPIITINSHVTGSVFMYNITDSHILTTGTLELSDDTTKLSSLVQKINEYATLHGYELEVVIDQETHDMKCIINDTGCEFKYIDKFGSIMECIAYYDSNNNYTILEGGFMYMNVQADNPMTVNCDKYQIYDSIQREVLLSDVGLEDVGKMYWMRYLNGDNTIRLFADNATFTFTHIEERKDGAV